MALDLPCRLESVSTNEAYSYEMPPNGVRYDKWWLRGGYEDVFRLDLDGMLYPLGTNLCDSLWVYTWGMTGARLGDAASSVKATGGPMSAVPGLSQFWSAVLPDGGRLLTWQHFFLNRDTNAPVSAQLELMPSGDFIARSNLVESVYRRVNPDDWDDDGIPNEEDINPLVYDGDNFGPHQTLPEDANTNHYYWMDIVVDQANALVTFEGDGYSHLSDPVFIAKAGETNRVMLLIGKPYSIECMMPVKVVGREDEGIVVSEGGGNISVEWPIYVSFVPLVRGGCATTATVLPQRASGGNFSWQNNFCCYSLAAGAPPIFDCDGTCGCGGCSTGEVTYEIGGHESPFAGFHCGCTSIPCEQEAGGDDLGEELQGPSILASFSESAIIFEDAYTNSPSIVVPRCSTDAEVTCEVYGGTNGGVYAFALYDGGRLLKKSGSNLPRGGTVRAGELFRFKVKYEAQSASGVENDVYVRGTFIENETGRELPPSDARLTAVKIRVVADSDFPSNKVRHVFGPLELFDVETMPSGWGRSGVLTSFDAGTDVVNLLICNRQYPVQIEVLHPDATLHGEFVRDMTAADWTANGRDPLVASVVGAGFVAKWFLTPLHVSFSSLGVQEGCAPMSAAWGCFTNQVDYPPSVYAHTPRNGAGSEACVGAGNLVGDVDYVGVQLGVPPVSNGGFPLVIPCTWGVYGGPYSHDFQSLVQNVSVTSNGTTTISKKDLSTTRSIE